MNITTIHQDYWFHDGVIKSFRLDIPNNFIEVDVLVSRIKKPTPLGALQKQDLTPCILRLKLIKLIEVSIFDKFPTQGYYLGFYTSDHGDEGIEIGFNVHDNSSYVYEKPNWIIKARQIAWKEL